MKSNNIVFPANDTKKRKNNIKVLEKVKTKETTENIEKTKTTETRYLVIVESPSKIEKIKKYLGHQYNVIASKGHIRTIKHLKDIDVKNNYKPSFTIIEQKQIHIKEMKKIIENYDKNNVIIATDNDREGESIGFHICEIFNLPHTTTKRIIFNEITETAIQNAIQNQTFLNDKIIHSQFARQIIDIIIGFKISPTLWKHIYHSSSNAKKSLSAGRCQTIALRLIYENYLEKKNIVVDKNYKITGFFFEKYNLPFILTKEFPDSNEDEIIDFLNKSKTTIYSLTIGEKKDSYKQPPIPLNTSKMLQIANNVLHYSPKTTMQIAQKLYQDGKITYMRTDTVKYSRTFIDTVKQYIQRTFTRTRTAPDEYIRQNMEIIENNIFGENPHEAIRVTNIFDIPTNDTPALYNLIWKHTLQSCMATAHYNTYELQINSPIENEYYKYTLEIPVFLGWKSIIIDKHSDSYSNNFEEKNTNDSNILFYLQNLQINKTKGVVCNKIEANIVVHNKHKFYTESTLIQKLEELEIGRPSTYSMFVETIQERDYVKKMNVEGIKISCKEYKLYENRITETVISKTFENENNKLIIQPIGILCIEFLMQHFNKIFDYNYTKEMEKILDNQITHNDDTRMEWYDICDKTYQDIQTLLKSLTKQQKTTYKIDDYNQFMFQQYGPCIRRTNPTDESMVEYYPIKKSLQIDLEKLKNGEYSLNELIEFENKYLGEYKNTPIMIKCKQYGYYLEWGVNGIEKKSLENINIEIEDITLNDAIEYIEGKNTEETGNHKDNKIFREFSKNTSVRQGKYGTYVYYKTNEMKSPKFVSLKQCPFDYMTCTEEEMVEWLLSKKTKKPPRKFYK